MVWLNKGVTNGFALETKVPAESNQATLLVVDAANENVDAEQWVTLAAVGAAGRLMVIYDAIVAVPLPCALVAFKITV